MPSPNDATTTLRPPALLEPRQLTQTPLPQTPAPVISPVTLLTEALGFLNFASTQTPTTPVDPPMLWAVLAWARRQFEGFVNPTPALPPMASTFTSALAAPVDDLPAPTALATTLAAPVDDPPSPAARTSALAATADPAEATTAAEAAPLAAVATVSTPYLPFDMPVGPTDKLVFAHYVPSLPLSPDNLPADQDYYTTQYLNPLGEDGAHAAYGGYMRDRPLPRDPINDPNWRYIDALTEVNQAKSVGIDGFAVDIIAPGSGQDAVINSLYQAAAATPGFSIQPTFDMVGPLSTLTPTQFAATAVPYLTMPGVQTLSDGRVVVGSFYAEAQPASWWSDAFTDLHDTYGVDVAFVPTFLDAYSNMESFAPISYGFSNWGGRNAVTTDPTNPFPLLPTGLANQAHSLGKLWMQPIAFQDERPREGLYEESLNTVTDSNGWYAAINNDAEWVDLLTWNDYPEGTAMAPSVDHGWRMLDMQAYSIAQYKYGTAPTVLRDAMYISNRTQFADAQSTYDETLHQEIRPGTPSAVNTVDVVVFATSPAVVVASIGGVVSTCGVGGGRSVCSFPLQYGDIIVGLQRDNQYVTIVQSPYSVEAQPYVEDLSYHVAGGLR